ncbi:MAG: NfeD family protein [Verrucomicrobiota bacterium]
MIFIIVLILLGLLLLGAEVILPGGIAGILGGICILVGMFQIYALPDLGFGWKVVLTALVLAAVMATLALGLKVFPKTPFAKWLTLQSTVAKVDQKKAHALAGASGNAVTDLRPDGRARLNGRLVDVHSVAGFVAAETEVKVVAADSLGIQVRPTSLD